MKMAIAVRTDLKIGKGKIAAQVAHGAVMNVLKIINSSNKEWKEWLNVWLNEGQPKIVVKVPDLNELLSRVDIAKNERIPYSVVEDAGKTQITPGTITCVSFGPSPDFLIDKVTGDLKLL
ncbi:peptidyl-tRNA hydrolase [Sulfolobales archaeon HS-7]|nr:peptidyl-tRNA hydrolase [Sulfolobales archaeon HS-7]